MNEPRPNKLVLVRHARSLWNEHSESGKHKVKDLPQELRGVPDHKTPLSDTGRIQAAKTGQALAEKFGSFDAVYFSPWPRATETAEIIINQFSEKARQSMAKNSFRSLFLIEQQFGDLDIGVNDPEEVRLAFEKFRRRRELVGKFYQRPPNGKSWADVCMQTHSFLDSVFQPRWTGKNILAVTHGITMQTFRYHLENLVEEKLVDLYHQDPPKNCGVSFYESAPAGLELRFWNRIFY